MRRAVAGPLLVLTVVIAACTSESSGCTGAAIDYSSSTPGAASPRAALTAYLAQASSSLPKKGWHVAATDPNVTRFESATATVEVARFRGGWNVTGYQHC